VTRESTLDELEETIFQGENFVRSYRLYVQTGCEIHKVGDFTFFLFQRGELKNYLQSTLAPFVEAMPRIPAGCSGEGNVNSEVLTSIARIESFSDLRTAYFYHFEKNQPLFSFHRESFKNRPK
jgi:hypothetical protein